jgi:hypothetical protein
LQAEINRDREKRSKPFTACDVHPFRKAPPVKAKPFSELGKEFEGGRQ